MGNAADIFTLRIQPITGEAWQYGFHLGTQEALAREIAEEKFRACTLHVTALAAVTLIQHGREFAKFNGRTWY